MPRLETILVLILLAGPVQPGRSQSPGSLPVPPGIPSGLPSDVPAGLGPLSQIPGLPPELAGLLQQFLAGHPWNGWFPGSSRPGGVGPTMWGELLPGIGGDPVATAREFLSRFGPLFGIPGDPGVLESLGTLHRYGEDWLTIVPGLEGVPYLPGRLSFSFGDDGRLVGVQGRYRKPENVTLGSMSVAQAIGMALGAMRERFPDEAVTGGGTVEEFLADDEAGVMRHLYQVGVIMGDPPQRRKVLLDAAGQLISVEDAAQYAVGQGKVMGFYPGYAVTTGPLYWMTEPQPSPIFGVTDFWRLESPWLRPTSHWTTPTSNDGNFFFSVTGPYNDSRYPRPEFLATNVYHHLQGAMFWSREFGAPWPGKPVVFDVLAGLEDNARILDEGSAFLVEYAYHNTQSATSPAMDASVSYHEYGHALHHVLSPGFDHISFATDDRVEALAVSEGFADAFSSCITMHPTNGSVFKGATGFRNAAVPPATGLTYDMVAPPYVVQPGGARFPAYGKVTLARAGEMLSSALWEIQLKLAQEKGWRAGSTLAGRILIRAMQPNFTGAPTTFDQYARGYERSAVSFGQGHLVPLIRNTFRRRRIPGF